MQQQESLSELFDLPLLDEEDSVRDTYTDDNSYSHQVQKTVTKEEPGAATIDTANKTFKQNEAGGE
ncbi:MAG: hypothetical protein LQ342_008542, partial [Letrouitia transgressa]